MILIRICTTTRPDGRTGFVCLCAGDAEMLRLICQTTTMTTTLWPLLSLLVLPLLLTATPTTSSAAAALQQQQQPYDCPKECICLSSTQVRYYLLLLLLLLLFKPPGICQTMISLRVCVCVCSLCSLLFIIIRSYFMAHRARRHDRTTGRREIRADFFWLSPFTSLLSIFCFIFFSPF